MWASALPSQKRPPTQTVGRQCVFRKFVRALTKSSEVCDMRQVSVLILALLLVSKGAVADEQYELFRVTCDKLVPSFQLEPLVLWNIRHVIWPSDRWNDHVQAMKRLEREAGIYALGEPYAYYDKPRTTWDCGAMHAEILFDKIQRENPIAGEPPVYIRDFPRLSIRIGSRSVLHMLPVYPYSVTAYGDYEGKPNLRLCSREQRCIEPSLYGRGPIDGQGADRLFKEAAESQ